MSSAARPSPRDGRCTCASSSSTCAASTTTFDEHKWGFATIMEFLRVLQREGLFRLERDRRGQIRVFPGSGAAAAAVATAASVEGEADEVRDVMEVEPVEPRTTSFRPKRLRNRSGPRRMAPETIEIPQSEPVPSRARRTRKTPAAGRPAARKSTGAKSSKRRKTLVPA